MSQSQRMRYVWARACEVRAGDVLSTDAVVTDVAFLRGGDVVEIHTSQGFNKFSPSARVSTWRKDER